MPEISGDISGQYDFWYTPYFLGVAAALDDDRVHEVDLMKAAQIGWTYFLVGYLFKRIRDASTGRQCPIMMLFAKEKDAKAFHDEKLVAAGMANASELHGLVDFTLTRKSRNRWDYKPFANGFLKLVGSNSPGNVKSTSSVGLGIVEEPDDTCEDVRGQGDAISNLEERLKRYSGSKLIVGGTPAVKGLSKTETRINSSDARVLPVRCHECGEKHVLDFANVTWDGKDGEADVDQETGEVLTERHDVYGFARPETARYVCPHCQAEWDDYQRQKNIRETVMDAIAAGDEMAGWVPTKPFHGKAGFMKLGEVYACIPGTTLADVVREYLEAVSQAEAGDASKMIKFVNQKLGEPYEYKSTTPEPKELMERAEDYDELTVPHGGLVLTAGVDVQHDRLAVRIDAWGVGEENWLVYWGELQAKTTTTDPRDPVWDALHNLLFTPKQHADGFQLRVQSVSIDASDGQTSDQVYSWVRVRQRYGVMAVKGSSLQSTDKEIYTAPRKIDFKNKTKAARHGLQVYIVGTHKAKDLLIGDRGRISLTGSGPGRMHWYKGVRSDFYDQLTSEVKAPHRSIRGKMVWQPKSGVRNEGLDCAVYSLHAARAIKLHLMTPQKWAELEARLKQADLFGGEVQEQPEQATQQQTRQPAPARRRSGGFATNWKR